MEAAVAGPATVLGTVRRVVALDERSFLAHLEVERSLSGSHASGEELAFAWDERLRDGPRRFGEGRRVLLVLEPLPGWSIWRKRLGDRRAVGVALRGEAFVLDPDPRTVDLLAAWLARSPAERSGTAALPALAALVEGASPGVARGALDRIDRTPGLARGLAGAPTGSLRRALLDAGRPDSLREAFVQQIGQRGLVAFRPELEALAHAPGPLAPAAVTAWAALPGGLATAEVESLMSRSESAVRAAALAGAPAGFPIARLQAALSEDPAPEVRSAAVYALVERQGMSVFAQLAPLLDDPNQPEGAAAIRALGGLGEPAVAPLARRARARGLTGARGPLLALSLAGPQGLAALREIGATHPDESVRGLANFLLGRMPKAH